MRWNLDTNQDQLGREMDFFKPGRSGERVELPSSEDRNKRASQGRHSAAPSAERSKTLGKQGVRGAFLVRWRRVRGRCTTISAAKWRQHLASGIRLPIEITTFNHSREATTADVEGQRRRAVTASRLWIGVGASRDDLSRFATLRSAATAKVAEEHRPADTI